MSHMTRKKLRERQKNDLKRVRVLFNVGTRSMAFRSNQERKDYSFRRLHMADIP